MFDEMTFDQPPKRGLSQGAKIGIGCGATALLLILVCGGLIGYFIYWGVQRAEDFAREFENRGYVRVSGQIIEVTQPVDAPTVYLAQVVHLRAPVNADIAIAGQVGEVHSTLDGDIDFFGQVLTIHPGAVVTGDIRATAQMVENNGTVQGQITGSVQIVQQPRRRAAPAPTELDPPAETEEPVEP